MTQPRLRSLLCALLAASLVGSAVDASLNPGDLFKGTISALDDVDVVKFATIKGSKFTATVKADQGEMLLPQIELVDLSTATTVASGLPGSKKVGLTKIVLPSTGEYEIRISGTASTTGAYTLKTAEKLGGNVTKPKFLEEIDAGECLEASFDAKPGMLLNARIGPRKSGAVAANPTLQGPGEAPIPLTPVQKGSSILLQDVELPVLGSYFLTAENAGETGEMQAKLKLKKPVFIKQTYYETEDP